MNGTVDTPSEARGAEQRPALSSRDILLGLVGAGMVVFALVLLLVGGERDTGAARPLAELPVLELVEPVDGAEIGGPLEMRFRSSKSLEHGSGGWGVDDLHVHLDLGGRSFMPGPRDIARVDAGHYRWTMPALPPGEHTLRLYWSGQDHRPLEGGASLPVRIRVR